MKPTDPLPTPKLHICKDHYKWYQGYHKMPWRTPLKFFLISDMQLKLRPLQSRSWEECLRGLWARLGDKRTHWGSERHPQLLEGPSWVLFSAVLRRQNADQKGKLRTSKKGISSGEGTELSAVDMVQQRQAEEPAEGTAASRGCSTPWPQTPLQALEFLWLSQERILCEAFLPLSFLPQVFSEHLLHTRF